MDTTEIEISRETKEIVMTRVFDAPRELVFRAYTDPELIEKWWGPRMYKTRVEKNDLRVGGRWRWLNIGDDGTEHAFRGEYLEIAPPARLRATFEYEGAPGQVVHQAARFDDVEGKTRVTVTSTYDTVEALDGMVQSGMEWGARESWDRLAELLVTV